MHRTIAAAALWVAAASAAPHQTYVYKTVGDVKIGADVYRPAGPGPFPAVLMLHGGSLVSGDRSQLHPQQLDHYLKAGYLVVSADYRLAPETKASGIFEDVQDVWRWMRTEKSLNIDPGRMVVTGGSAGGYLSLVAGYILEPRPGAVLSFSGFGDPTKPWESKPWPRFLKEPLVSPANAWKAVGQKSVVVQGGPERRDFSVYLRQTGRWPQEVVGFDPEIEPRALDHYCPIRNVTPAYPPTMLWHGDQDTNVPLQESVDMAAELKRKGVEHELVIVPGAGHGFMLTEEQCRSLLSFVAKHLNPRKKTVDTIIR